MKKRPRRFQLLLYKRYHQAKSGLSKFLIGLGLFLAACTAAGWVFLRSRFEPAGLQTLLTISLVIAGWGVLRLLFTLLVSKTAYVECRPRSLKIQTPFLPLVISYKRIKSTRPSVVRELFPPDQQKRGRELLEAYWGETILILEMNQLPMSPRLIKTIMGPYMLDPGGQGLALLVDDWMALSRQLDQVLNEYRTQRARR